MLHLTNLWIRYKSQYKQSEINSSAATLEWFYQDSKKNIRLKLTVTNINEKRFFFFRFFSLTIVNKKSEHT